MQTARTLTTLSLILSAGALSACQPEPAERGDGIAYVNFKTTATAPERMLIDAQTYEPIQPIQRYEALRVNVDTIEAHSEAEGWQTVAVDVGWVSLVEAEQTMDQTIADGDVPEGEYDEIRLILLDAELDLDSVVQPVTVPSGMQTGIKIKDTFCLADDAAVNDLEVHWDLMDNLHVTGNGELILNPTVTLEDAPDDCSVDDDDDDRA